MAKERIVGKECVMDIINNTSMIKIYNNLGALVPPLIYDINRRNLK